MKNKCPVCGSKNCCCVDVCTCTPKKECNDNDKCLLKECSRLLKIISDETRLKILVKLLNGNKCVCELENGLNVSQSCVSHQLKVLKDANLVDCEKSGNKVTYKLKDKHIEQLISVGLEHVKESK